MSARPTTIRLYIPGLAADFSGIAKDVFPAMPTLSKILARSERVCFQSSSHEDTTFKLFGIPASSAGISAASLRYLGQTGKLIDQYCICIDPVHLRTETSGLTLIGGDQISIADRDSKAFQNAIRALFAEDGWTLYEGDSKHWYLCSEKLETIQCSPISTVIGKSIANHLPDGENGKMWQSRLNEVQMLLHASPENQQRIANRQLPINSVWLWGGGQFPKDKGAGFTRAYTTDLLTKGLALWTKTQVSGEFDQFEECMADLNENDTIYIQIEDLFEASLYGDFVQWSDALSALETKWFIPLWSSLRRAKVSVVELIAGDGYLYRLTRRNMLRFWRKEVGYHFHRKL